jgi:hypothetical protein
MTARMTSAIRWNVFAASEPNVALRLSQAVTARGMYGMTRQVTSVGLAVDDPEGLVRALTHGV